MAFKKKLNDLRGILTLMVLTLPSIAANIDCNGRPFHCVNSTHFMICVDLGSGVSSTIDDFVIPCPPTTVCQGTNRFECEFPAVSTVTSAPLKPSVSETIRVETTPVHDETTSIPYEEYYDTVSTTTLSEDILLTQLEIVTKSILPVTEEIKFLTVTGSNYNLNDTVAKFELVQNKTTKVSPFLPNNLESTVTELTTSLNAITVSEINSTRSEFASVDVVQNDTTTITPLNNTISKTITEVNLGFTENVIAPLTEPVQTLSETIASVDVSLTETASTTPLFLNIDTTVTEITINHNETPELGMNFTKSETIASLDAAQNETTTITPLNNIVSITVTENITLTEPIDTLNETIASVDISLNETESTLSSINIDSTVSDVTTNPNDIPESGMNYTKSETIASVGVVHNYTTTLTALNNTISIPVTEVNLGFTEDVNILLKEPTNTLSETIASADVSLDETASTLLSINIDTTVSEVTTNPNDIPESGMNFTKSENIASVDMVHNYDTTLTPLNNTISIPVTEVSLGFTEDVNILLTEPTNTLSETIASVDVSLNETASTTPIASVDVVQNDTITIISPLNNTVSITVTEIKLGFTENVNVPLTEPDHILSETNASADVALIETTAPTPLSNNINTTVTEVTTNANEIPESGIHIPKSETIARVHVVQMDTTRLAPSNNTISIPVTEINLGFTEDVNVPLTESINTLVETIASVDVLQNDTTTLTLNMENIYVKADLDAIQNDASTVISSDSNTNINATKVTPADEIGMPISELNSPLDEVIGIKDVNKKYSISLSPLNNKNSATEVNFTKIPDPEAESTQSETISSIRPHIVADNITDSIFKEATLSPSSLLIDILQENQSTFNIPNNSALSLKTEKFVTEAINSNQTENINLVNPRSIPNVSAINSSDNFIQTEQPTPYTWASISVPFDQDGIGTETIVAVVIDKINQELKTSSSINNAENEHTTVKDILNANIGLDIKVSNVSNSKNVITTEPKLIVTETVMNYSNNVELLLTTSFSPSSDNLPNNDIAKDSKLIDNTHIKILENTVSTNVTPTVAIIDTVGITTPSTSNAAGFFINVKVQTNDVNQSTSQEATSLDITKENKTESVTVDNMLKDSTVMDIRNSMSTEIYYNNAEISYTSEATLAKSTSSYYRSTGEAGITITNNDNALKTTPNIMSSNALPEVFESSTYYSNVYYYPDTENIANGPGVLINQTDGKPIHSEKVLSTGKKDTATTQVIAVRTDKLVTGTLVSAIDTNESYQATTEASPSSNMPKLILNTEPARVTEQKTNKLENSTLVTNDKILSQLASLDTNFESFQKVNISSSGNVVAKSQESVLTMQTPNESVNLNAGDKFIIDASEIVDTTTEFAGSDGIVFITHVNLPADSSSISYRNNTASVRPDDLNEDIVTTSVPGLSTSNEVITTEDAMKSNGNLLLDKTIDKSQSDIISIPIQATVSSLTVNKFQTDLESVLDIIPDIEAHPTIITERLDSVKTESTILVNADKKEISSTIPKREVTNSPRFLTEGTKSSVMTTESYPTVNEATTTIASVGKNNNNYFINNEQAIRKQNSNPLLKLIINSDVIQTKEKERTIPDTFNYIPATLINVNEVTEPSSIYTQAPTVALESSTKKATYKEHMEIIPPHETLSNGKGINSMNQNANYGPLTEISTSAIQHPAVQTNASLAAAANTQPQMETLQSDKAVNERIVGQFSIGNVMNSNPRDITAIAHSNFFPTITENVQTISTKLSQEQVTASNHVDMNLLPNQENIGFKKTSTSPITDIQTNHSNTPSNFVTTTETSYKASIPGSEHEGTFQIAMFANVGQGVGSNIFKSTSQVPEATKSSLDTVIQTQRTRSVTTGLPTKSPNVNPANVNQDSHKTETATEAWRATVVTKQTIPITTPIIAVEPEQQIILAGPNPKSWKQIPTISETTARPLTEFNVQHVTSPSITIEQSSIDISSSSLTTEKWRILETSTNAADPVVHINKVSKNNVVDQTTKKPMKTEFINIQIVDQNRDKMTTPILETNLPGTGVVTVDILKTVISILGGKKDSSIHSGISVISQASRKSEQSEQLEASESVELPESKEGKEIQEKPRGKDTGKKLDSSVNYKGEKSTATQEIGKNKSKLDTAFEIKENTAVSRSTITVKSIEMTTKKVEESPESGFRSITNIEQVSPTLRPDLKDKLLHNDSIATANIASDKTNVKNSIARYIPQTKSSFTNTHNTSVPAFKTPTTTITRNFVCKPNNRGRFPDNKDCRKFYICIGKSEPIEGTCQNNTVFSVLRKQCTKNLSHCVRNNQFQCISEGRFSDHFTTNIYYICVKNNVGTFIRFKLQCQSGYHLNKTSVRCVLNTEPSQSTSQKSTSDVSKDSNQSVSSTRRENLFKEPSKTNQFECYKEGKFPNANNCRKYYVCKKIGKSKYRQKSKKCDSDELFHKDKKRCVDADSYECS